MDKENNALPIKFFAPREIDELRIEGNKNSDKPKWVLCGDELQKRAEHLNAALDEISGIMEKRKASPVPFSFIAKLQEDANKGYRRGYWTQRYY